MQAKLLIVGAIASAMLSACATHTSEQRQAEFAPWLAAERSQDDNLLIVTVRDAPASVGMRSGSSARDYGTGEDYGPSPRARAAVRQLAQRYQLREVNGWPIQSLNVHCVVFAAPHRLDLTSLIERLRRDEQVESAQPLQSFATMGEASAVRDEPYAQLQANLGPMEILQAHRITRGDGVRVAVIDTGIDSSHPDLKGRIAEQRDFAGAGPATVAAMGVQSLPPERHGTAVAGIIAARDDNGQGIVGVAPGARILALRACWPRRAADALAVCNTFTLAQALSAAIELRADVVNLSLSGPPDPLLARLVAAGLNRGIVYVGAMPLDGPLDNNVAGFPDAVPGVIRVASSGHIVTENVAIGTRGLLRAPGDEQLTLTPAGGYDFLSGSSLAAANVSGGVALLLARRPKLSSSAVVDALSASMRAASSVNLCAALLRVDQSAECELSPQTARR